ncbi:MAG: hypothetical protein WA324_13800, partial [Bryobacteraceae bacterium]
MLDWTPLRDAIAAGSPNFGMLATLRKVSGWLELSLDAAKAALIEEKKTCSPADLYRSLITLNFSIQRQAGIPGGADAGPELQKLWQEYQQGTASGERKRAAAKLAIVWELAGMLLKEDPGLSQGPSQEDIEKSKLQSAATAIFNRMNGVANQTAPGTVTDFSIQTLENVRRDADALIAGAGPENTALPFVFYMSGSAARLLAGCYAIVGRNDDAMEAYAVAAEYFKKAGEPQQADDCQSRASNLQQHLLGSLDAAAERPLTVLSQGARSETPLARVKARMELSGIAGSAADTFEALEHAEAAAKELSGEGYLDPGTDDPESAVASWIKVAAAELKGTPLLGRLSQIGTWYDSILGARFAVLVRTEAAAAESLLSRQVAVQKLNLRLIREAKSAEREIKNEFQKYFPPPPGAVSDEETSSDGEFDELLDRMRAVDSELAGIRQICNQRAEAKQDMDDLLAAVGKLETESDSLNSPEYEAKTRLERAYILLQLGRGADLASVSRDARARLLAGRVASLSSFAQSHQRELYL